MIWTVRAFIKPMWRRFSAMPGHVYQCPVCKEVVVKVYPQGGGREWVIIPPNLVEFHRLVEGIGDE